MLPLTVRASVDVELPAAALMTLILLILGVLPDHLDALRHLTRVRHRARGHRYSAVLLDNVLRPILIGRGADLPRCC